MKKAKQGKRARRPGPGHKQLSGSRQRARGAAARPLAAKLLAQARALVPPHGSPEAALEVLAQVWPQRDPPLPGRMAWLFKSWPERALVELAALGPFRDFRALHVPDGLAGDSGGDVPGVDVPGVEEVAASAVLALSDEHVAALCALPGITREWREQARVLRAAAARIAAGEGRAGLDLLRVIGMRSPFRNARMFLRGLAAYYEREDRDAMRALALVRRDPVLGHAARQISWICRGGAPPAAPGALAMDAPVIDVPMEAPTDAHLRPLDAPDVPHADALALLGCPELVAVNELTALLAARRYNAAIRAAEAQLQHAAPVWREALLRELAAALVAAGMRPASVGVRLARAMAAIRRRPRGEAGERPAAPGDGDVRRRHRDSARLRAAHLTALAAGSAGRQRQAQDAWLEVEACLQHDVDAFSADERRRARAEILAREAARALQQARLEAGVGAAHELDADEPDAEEPDADEPDADELDDGEPDDATADAHAGAVQALRDRAVAWLEQAAALAPEEPGFWISLVRALEEAGDDRGRTNAVARMMAALPQHVDALQLAASEAAARHAWAAARGYLHDAQALEPLNRALRDAEARLLLDQARAVLGTGDGAGARALYDEAVRLAQLTAEVRLVVLAEVAAFHAGCNEPQSASALCQEALRVDPRPWLWAWLYLAAGMRAGHGRAGHGQGGRGQRVGGAPDRIRTAIDLTALLSAPPARDELQSILLLAEAHVHDHAALPPPLEALVDDALARGHEQLDDLSDFLLALSLASRPHNALAIAERGRALCPGDPKLVLAVYAIALALEKPVAYFRTADDDLAAVLDSLGFGDESLAEKLVVLAEMFEDELAHPVVLTLRLRSDIRDYINQAHGPAGDPGSVHGSDPAGDPPGDPGSVHGSRRLH